MAEQYHGMAIGIFELDSECACFVALDAAAKAAAVQIQEWRETVWEQVPV